MSDRTWNAVDARLYEEDWSQCAKLVAGVLLARCPNQYGVFKMPWWFLSLTFHGIYTRAEMDLAVTEWEADGWVKFYGNHEIVWIKRKWRRCQVNPTERHIAGALAHLKDFPEVRDDFMAFYEISNAMPMSLPCPPNGIPSDPDPDPDPEKKQILPSKGDGDLSEDFLKVQDPEGAKNRKPYIPIEDREAKTDVSKLVRRWHRDYLAKTGIKYTGDAKKMGGQAATLLKRNSLNDLLLGLTFLLDQPQTQYVRHTWDHFVTRCSFYIEEGRKVYRMEK